MDKIAELVELVRKKKDFSDVDGNFIREFVLDFIEFGKINLVDLKEKEIKEVVSQIRRRLRNVVGVFQSKDSKKRFKILDEVSFLKDKDKILEILKTHISTKERLEIYPELYKKISDFSGKSNLKILDLGCGLNPLAIFLFDFFDNKKIDYSGMDISQSDTEFLNKFFNKFKIKGKFECGNVLSAKFKEHYDLCFMFKLLDAVEFVKRDFSEELIKSIDAEKFVVSFATRSLSGREKIRDRKWFERILEKNKWKYEILKFDNEIFYLFGA